MGTEAVLDRVREDVEAGDLGLARLRLQSALAATGSDAVRRELVRVCRLAGDPAAAGRYGFLTDDVAEHELAALAARNGGRATLILRSIGPIGQLERLSPDVRVRVRDLEARKASDPPGVGGVASSRELDWTDRAFTVGCVSVLVLLVAIFGVGLFVVVRLLVAWLG